MNTADLTFGKDKTAIVKCIAALCAIETIKMNC